LLYFLKLACNLLRTTQNPTLYYCHFWFTRCTVVYFCLHSVSDVILKVLVFFLKFFGLHFCPCVPISLQIIDIVLLKLTCLRYTTVCLDFFLQRYTWAYFANCLMSIHLNLLAFWNIINMLMVCFLEVRIGLWSCSVIEWCEGFHFH